MKKINELLKKYELKPYRYQTVGKTTIVDTEIGRFAIKESKRNEEIFNYLKSRSFNYYPAIAHEDERYQISEYVEGYEYPSEQKMQDLIHLLGLMHNKTTHYKEVDFEDYKEIYEDIENNIEYLIGYYNDHITLIDTHVYMSPSEYLLARNISKIYAALAFCKSEVEKWYKLVKDQTKQRFVVLHNNLELDHFIRNDKSYFVSWDKAKIGIPIFDMYILYKHHALDFNFEEIMSTYEKEYPLKEEERKLLFILIALPNKIDFDQKEYALSKAISKEIDILYKTEKLISPYYSKQSP